MDDLPEQRVAVVTGAARGIGAAVAARLAADGHAVALLDLDEASAVAEAKQIAESGYTAIGLACDVALGDSVAAAFANVEQALGAPTVLVNNAGFVRDSYLFKMSEQQWDEVVDVHLKGAFLMSKAAQAHMTKAGWGRIVNISSVSALGNPGQANYSAAKAGVQGFTKTLALELGKFGVTVNAIAPGFIITDMTEQTAARMGITFAEFKERSAKDIAVRRVGVGADIANAVAFFVSPDSGFVSGQVLYVSGGPLC